MNILVFSIGSAGDVHPFVALALALKARGHDVTFITNGHFEPLVRRVGLEYLELGTEEDYRRVLELPEVWHPTRSFPLVADWGMIRPMRRSFEIIKERNVPGETVVVGPLLAFGARVAQEVLGVPLVSVLLQPTMLRNDRTPPHIPKLPVSSSMPPAWNRFLYWFADVAVIDRVVAAETNAFRAEFGLPPVRRLFANWWFSPTRVLGLFPEWYAPTLVDSMPQLRMTGFPLYDEADRRPLDPELEAFLDAGPPPIAFTPGSAMRHGREFFRAAVEAVRRLGRRAVLISPYRDQLPSPLPPEIRAFDFIPFSRVFPRAAAVVHHGGIGTSAQGLAAGVPQLLMPMAHDQFDNAERLKRLDVARWLPTKQFRPAPVAQALDELINSPHVAAQSRATAERLRQANPLEDSCRLIEDEVGIRDYLATD